MSKKQTSDATTSGTTSNQLPLDTGESDIPQALPESIPQALPESIPQALPESIPQALPKSIPRDLPEAVPQALPQSNALSGEKNKKPQLCLSVALVTFASAFVVCRHPIRERSRELIVPRGLFITLLAPSFRQSMVSHSPSMSAGTSLASSSCHFQIT